MPFVYKRTVRFQDTDAAGVVYFANVLAMCHEAYEASLAATEIDLKVFFSNPAIAIPIVHAEVDFFRPLFCGDQLQIQLTPQLLSAQEFIIHYQIFAAEMGDRALCKAQTRHVCIDPTARVRQDLSNVMLTWLKQWADAATPA